MQVKYLCEVKPVRSVLTALLAFGFALLLPAQEGDVENPYTSAEDIAAGSRIFRSHCAVCHAIDGSGGRGSDLTSGTFRHGSSTEAIYENIGEGIPGTEMPATFFRGKQLWQLVAYVRSLSEAPQSAAGLGDASRGQTLLEGKGGCRNCHQVNGEGARSGPELTYIGGQRSAADLRASLLRPNERVLPKDYRVSAVTKSGQKVSGRRLNEDSFSIQLIDTNENLVSLSKQDVSDFSIDKTSSMPAMGGMFSEQEMEDLLAYLVTLQRKGNLQ